MRGNFDELGGKQESAGGVLRPILNCFGPFMNMVERCFVAAFMGSPAVPLLRSGTPGLPLLGRPVMTPIPVRPLRRR